MEHTFSIVTKDFFKS